MIEPPKTQKPKKRAALYTKAAFLPSFARRKTKG